MPEGLLPGRGGVLLLGVRQHEHPVKVHDHLPVGIRRRGASQLPHVFADLGSRGPDRCQDSGSGPCQGVEHPLALRELSIRPGRLFGTTTGTPLRGHGKGNGGDAGTPLRQHTTPEAHRGSVDLRTTTRTKVPAREGAIYSSVRTCSSISSAET